MKKILVFSIITILLVSIIPYDVDALQQIAGKVKFDLKPGESATYDWGLASDDTKNITTVELSVTGDGAEFFSFEKTVNIEPQAIQYTTVTVNIPENYPGGITLTPMLLATEFGDQGGTTIINIQMIKITALNIALNDNPDLWVDWDEQKIDEEPSTVEPQSIQEEIAEEPEKQMMVIQSGESQIDADPQMDAEPASEKQCGAGTELVNGICKIIMDKEPEATGGGCLIATAAYGTEMAPQVQFLREIRDNTVMSTASGISFMTGFNQLYYSFSPFIADMERENPMFQEAVRAFITPMISTLSIMTLAEDGNDTQVLGLGISVIALNLGLYLAAPAVTAWQIKKRL